MAMKSTMLLATLIMLIGGSCLLVPTGAVAKEIIVDELIPIPPPEEEIVTVRPSTSDVWIPGYWERQPDTWTWIKGRWEKPPHKHAHWQKGQWSWQEGTWAWHPGHWVVANQGWVVDEMIDVPDPLYEMKPPKPSDKDHWVAGHWDWAGSWFWVPGYYTTKPKPDAEWVPGAWLPLADGGYWWMGGHWTVK